MVFLIRIPVVAKTALPQADAKGGILGSRTTYILPPFASMCTSIGVAHRFTKPGYSPVFINMMHITVTDARIENVNLYFIITQRAAGKIVMFKLSISFNTAEPFARMDSFCANGVL